MGLLKFGGTPRGTAGRDPGRCVTEEVGRRYPSPNCVGPVQTLSFMGVEVYAVVPPGGQQLGLSAAKYPIRGRPVFWLILKRGLSFVLG